MELHLNTQNNTPEIRIILDDDALKEAVSMSEYFMKFGKLVKLVNLNGHDPNILGRFKTQELVEKTKILTFSDIVKFRIK